MRDLTEDEKTELRRFKGTKAYNLILEFLEDRQKELRDNADEALTESMVSVLGREQLLGGSRHIKYLKADLITFVNTKQIES